MRRLGANMSGTAKGSFAFMNEQRRLEDHERELIDTDSDTDDDSDDSDDSATKKFRTPAESREKKEKREGIIQGKARDSFKNMRLRQIITSSRPIYSQAPRRSPPISFNAAWIPEQPLYLHKYFYIGRVLLELIKEFQLSDLGATDGIPKQE
jgi:hypothetical protein